MKKLTFTFLFILISFFRINAYSATGYIVKYSINNTPPVSGQVMALWGNIVSCSIDIANVETLSQYGQLPIAYLDQKLAPLPQKIKIFFYGDGNDTDVIVITLQDTNEIYLVASGRALKPQRNNFYGLGTCRSMF